jgi:hypothetical protein
MLVAVLVPQLVCDLRTCLRRRPLVPIRLILSSGTTYDILHWEVLFKWKSGITVAIYEREQHEQHQFPDGIPARESLTDFAQSRP